MSHVGIYEADHCIDCIRLHILYSIDRPALFFLFLPFPSKARCLVAFGRTCICIKWVAGRMGGEVGRARQGAGIFTMGNNGVDGQILGLGFRRFG